MQIKGEFEGVIFDNFTFEDPLVECSISSFELSGGTIICKLFFLIWEHSILSSIDSSFISLIKRFGFALVFDLIGFNNLGCSFCFGFFGELFSWFVMPKKSSGNIFLLQLLLIFLYIFFSKIYYN